MTKQGTVPSSQCQLVSL